MNIALTGSLGHISKPLAQELLWNGHCVTIISSNPEKQKDIEALGAKAAIGTIEDVDFLTAAFKDTDIVYAMLPPVDFFNNDLNFANHHIKIVNNYKQAILQSGTMQVINLSSIAAHTNKGNGMLAYAYEMENILKELPDYVAIKFMRPVGFYYNMFAFIPAIKNAGAIIQNYGGNEKEPWVSPLDIAAVIAEEMEKPFEGRTTRYIASDELSPNEVAKILGEATGNPALKWITIPDEQFLNNLIAAGFNPAAAKSFAEMNAGRRGGLLYEDYYQHKPILGKIKMEDFAKEFATVYHQ